MNEEAKRAVEEYRRTRALVLSEVWTTFRDQPGGPMIDSMMIVAKLMEEQAASDQREGK